MLRLEARIISDGAKAPKPTRTGEWHEVTGHHRYYGSAATNGGERMTEARRGPRPRPLNVCGF